jgi:aminomethyltransferase
MSVAPSRSPLHALNEQLGARFVDFGGWEMPLQYDSVLTEHAAVRTSAAWFDVSHLGRFLWRGPGAQATLVELLSNDVRLIGPGQTQYTLCLNESGGIVDDLLIWQWDRESYWVLPNASTHVEMMERFRAHAPGVEMLDLRSTTAMVAVQGPEAPKALEAIFGIAPKRFRTYMASFDGAEVHLAGTGYTGERGGEFVADPVTAESIVKALGGMGVGPAGLGARDTLRLEARLLLAGQDFDADVNPYEAGLEFAVSFDHDFVGRVALQGQLDGPPAKRLVAFKLEGRKIPRHGYKLRAGDGVGTVTSGNYSPILECGIGLGYTPGPFAEGPMAVEIRGVWEAAEEVTSRFLEK